MYSKLQLNYNYVGDYAIVLIQRQLYIFITFR